MKKSNEASASTAHVFSTLPARVSMKAAVYRRYGPPEVVTIEEMPRPTPGDNEVLIRVHAATVTSADARLRSARVPPGFTLLVRLAFGISGPRKRVLGTEAAGVVEAVGRSVSRFEIGDKVFAMSGANLGCHAEYVTLREGGAMAAMPDNVSFQEAAALAFGGTTALFFLRDNARIQPGERVLVNGASGAVGSAAVQLASHFGADVTAVCSAANASWVRALGARHVIDYAKEDFTRSPDTFDIVLDAVGNCSFTRCKPVLAPGGRLLLVVAGLGQTVSALLWSSRGGRKVMSGVTPERAEDLLFLSALAASGTFKPVIEHAYPFEQIVDAYARVDSQRKKGNVVLTIAC